MVPDAPPLEGFAHPFAQDAKGWGTRHPAKGWGTLDLIFEFKGGPPANLKRNDDTERMGHPRCDLGVQGWATRRCRTSIWATRHPAPLSGAPATVEGNQAP